MTNSGPAPAATTKRPFQFSLKEAAVWALVLCFVLALIFQWGFWGVIGCLVAAALGALCYGTYWGEWKLAAVAASFLLLAAGVGLFDEGAERIGPRPMRCENRLKQIGLALHNYADTYGSFPPPYVADANGQPMHSWRVLILPFMEERDLYERYDFSEPWNGPNNSKLCWEMPNVYRCSDLPRGATWETAFLAITGVESIWPEGGGVTSAQITDGSKNTLVVVEHQSSSVNWLEPRDIRLLDLPVATLPQQGHGIISRHRSGAAAQPGTWGLFADGSVRFLPRTLTWGSLRDMATIAGGEHIALPED